VSGKQLTQGAIASGGPIDALVISVGGNDIGFAKIVGACLALPCDPATALPFASKAAALDAGLNGVISKIRSLPVPVRPVFITEYPEPSSTPFPPPADRCGGPLTPNIPGSGFENLFQSKADLAVATIIKPLNGALAAAVARANAGSGPGGPV